MGLHVVLDVRISVAVSIALLFRRMESYLTWNIGIPNRVLGVFSNRQLTVTILLSKSVALALAPQMPPHNSSTTARRTPKPPSGFTHQTWSSTYILMPHTSPKLMHEAAQAAISFSARALRNPFLRPPPTAFRLPSTAPSTRLAPSCASLCHPQQKPKWGRSSITPRTRRGYEPLSKISATPSLPRRSRPTMPAQQASSTTP